MSKLFCKIGWIVLIRSDFTPYPSAALLSPLRVLDLFSFLLQVQDSRGWVPSYLQGFASFFGNGVATSGLHVI